ncbi:hypothetical protein BJX63DRAFT_205215 [Aspergillus granulosus]|uniref:Mitochondrial export protein Som1 n=1 Tax=Aspergillus granulosus TaxID=176169 RepID=A0ABR4HG83_9EURO
MMELQNPPLSSEICSASITLLFLVPSLDRLHSLTPTTESSRYLQNPLSIFSRKNHPMAPLVPFFSAEALPDHVNTVTKNFQEVKRRKGGQIELEKCKLLEMVQYSCNPPQDGIPQPGVVVCKPVVRLFRRCAGGLTVETTSWEPIRQAKEDARRELDARDCSKA